MIGRDARTAALRPSTGPGYLIARLDRPDRRNTIDAALLAALHGVLDRAEADPTCRTFVLAATGADFCAGMELTLPSPDSDTPAGWGPGGPAGWNAGGQAGELPYWRLLRRLATCELITVAIVDGRATAGGVGLAAACDLVLAGAAARFRLTEVLLGLLPAMALPFVARRTGEQCAFRLALTAADLDAVEAERVGLADRVGPSAEDLLRPTLVSARRLERAIVGALKRYRDQAFPAVGQAGPVAQRAFLDRLADPVVTRRLAELREGGLLR